ncbi:MAG TPA: HEAT repeat domain-containing protein, partial [Candidatus Limnocylindria bacterium]
MGIGARLLRIRAGETRMALTLVGLMLVTSAGAGIGGTASDALLFARYGTAALPQLYLALGVVSFVCALGVSAVFGRVRRERVYPAALVALAALLVAVRAILLTGSDAAYPVMWLAANVVLMLQGIVAWGVASWLCDARQARRLFPVANAAKILGTIVGTASVGAFLVVARLDDLLIVWSVALVGALLVVVRIRGDAPATLVRTATPLREELLIGFRIVRTSSLLRWLAVSLVLFSVLFFALALPFTRAARAAMPDERDLASFLGVFNATTTAAAFCASLFVAERFYARFGVVNAILVFTLIYLAGFVTLVATGSFLVIAAIRWIQMAWLAGMADAAYQALFNPVPPDRRDQMRAFMEGVPGQAGIALAGLLLMTGDLAFDPRAVALGGAVAAAATFAVIWRTRGAYREALVSALRAGRPEPFLGADDSYGRLLADRAAVRTLLGGARSEDVATRRASLQMLADVAVPEARDALLAAATDDDAVVRAHALRGGARLAPQAFVDAARDALAMP